MDRKELKEFYKRYKDYMIEIRFFGETLNEISLKDLIKLIKIKLEK
ncbi:MAG TPA: hypothetical protein VN704_04835 [Verrucomicrobiae bacterium]|nr:hypothetical protein [Verrucomicrobiae bacterium]